MTTRTLIAYDGSPAARAAIATAGMLLAPADAVVVTVRDPDLRAMRSAAPLAELPDDVLDAGLAEIERRVAERARSTSEEGVALARAAGLRPTGVVTAAARPWRAIADAADEHGADLVVCGTHGHGPIGRAFLGSTATSLLHHAPVPVLAVPAGAQAIAARVVVAYDGSPAARRALDFAAAHLHSEHVVVVHVWSSPVRHPVDAQLLSRLPATAAHALVAGIADAFTHAAAAVADDGVARAEAHGLEATGRIVESSSTPWRALLRDAAADHATLVVAGSGGEDAAGALGAVTAGLVHHATTAVLVVPATTPHAHVAPVAEPAVAAASR